MAKHYKPSKLIRQLQKQLEEREQQGLSLYGNTLEGNNLPSTKLIEHAIEEQLDAASYLTALKPQIDHVVGENEMLRSENSALKDENEAIKRGIDAGMANRVVQLEQYQNGLQVQLKHVLAVCANAAVSVTFTGDFGQYVEAVLAVQNELCKAEVEKYRNRNEEPVREALAKALGYSIDDEEEDGAVMATRPDGAWDVLPEMEILVEDVKALRAQNLGLKSLLDDTRKHLFDHDLDTSEEGRDISRRIVAAISSKTTVRGVLGELQQGPPGLGREGTSVEPLQEVLRVAESDPQKDSGNQP